MKVAATENLYQACRFPTDPELQELILGESNPIRAKKMVRLFRTAHARPDWDSVRVAIMKSCLDLQLAQH